IEIVKAPSAPVLASVPEYSIRTGEAPGAAASGRRKKIQGQQPEATSAVESSQAAAHDASGAKAV
ncbi:MAG: hypothetical protein ACRD2G_18795, partial [Terriglobia bacterium]